MSAMQTRSAKRELDASNDEAKQGTAKTATAAENSKPETETESTSEASSSAPPEHESTAQDKPPPGHLQLIEITGDIFDDASGKVLVHSCNCEGAWGAGIAKTFKDNYVDAYGVYHEFCLVHGKELFGKALLIPPQHDSDPFVGCLFTSRGKGKTKDSPMAILKATTPAMQDLLGQIKAWNAGKPVHDLNSVASEEKVSPKIEEMRICQINSGLFNVPWEKTKSALKEIELGDDDPITKIHVVSRA